MKINKWNLLTIFTFIVCLLFIAGCGGKAPVADKKPTETKPSATAAQKQVYFATGTPGGVYQILGANEAPAPAKAKTGERSTVIETDDLHLTVGEETTLKLGDKAIPLPCPEPPPEKE